MITAQGAWYKSYERIAPLLILLFFIVQAWNHQRMPLVEGPNTTQVPVALSFVQAPSMDIPIVTFVIPSKGRVTIHETISSLFSQSEPRWEAVIVFDGVQSHSNVTFPSDLDTRIRLYTIPKTGEQNFAGILRNYGMTKARGDWIAFVDDDDSLSSDYVNRLQEEMRLNEQIETVIFRMSGVYSQVLQILPPRDDEMFRKYWVGISFAIRRHLFEGGFWFLPSSTEDYDLLQKILDGKKRMVISPYVTYFVRGAHPEELDTVYPRHYI